MGEDIARLEEDDTRDQNPRGQEFKNPRGEDENLKIRESYKRTRMQGDDKNNEDLWEDENPRRQQ